MTLLPAISTVALAHRYGEVAALAGLTLEIRAGEFFAIVGPNGGGKSTLFRILSTLMSVQAGEVRVLGLPLPAEEAAVRLKIGVVFQSAGVDKQLTVAENLWHQGVLYGLWGQTLSQRQSEAIAQLGLEEKAHDLVGTLSGGMQRRVELAKALLHRPELLLLDEPTTGLDPAARADFWEWIDQLRKREEMTVVFTSHLLEEADRADRVAILHEGKLVACDSPDALRAEIGEETMQITARQPEQLAEDVRRQFELPAQVVDGEVRVEHPQPSLLIARLVEAFPGRIDAIRVGRPTLADVFLARTGRRFAAGGMASHA